jgi:hypothetical protein
VKRVAAAGVLALVLAACGSQPAAHGHAAVWITRDRGAKVLLAKTVPAGLTAMEALQRVAKVKTRYGGRFVQSIDGLAGSLGAHRDWFYFVNGYEADRGAADYTLHPGDVEWWDYRSWAHAIHVPIVVGAFPEPFLHGYDGKRHPNVVASLNPSGAGDVARRLHARSLLATGHLPKNANILFLGPPVTSVRFEAKLASGSGSAGAPVRMLYVGDWSNLFKGRYRYRYEVRP